MPVNANALPTHYLQSFERLFVEIQPNLRQVVYQLKKANVSWHGTVIKGLRVFVPSLPQVWLEKEFGGSFLLRQLSSKSLLDFGDAPVGLVFDSWSENYFHWIAEALPRLALLRKVQPNAIVLLPGAQPPEFVTHTVRALGFTKTYNIAPQQIVKVANLWVPARPGRHGYMSPSLTLEVRQAVLDSVTKYLNPARQATRRLYVSRSRQKWRQLTNEEEVLSVLKRYGFETIYFEDMKFVEQVQTMYEASVFIGIHGANLTNILFMTPGANAIEIMSDNYINPSYVSMATSVGVHYSLVPGKQSPPPEVENNYADVTVDPALIEQVLQNIC
jgi:capsular polysaccharide biosynthesis protein